MKPNSITDTLDEHFARCYFLVGSWESNLAFYRGELNFLSSLINRYFVFFMVSESFERVQNMAIQLKFMLQIRFELSEKRRNLVALDYPVSRQNENETQDYHPTVIEFGKRMSEFRNAFKILKKRFSPTRSVFLGNRC